MAPPTFVKRHHGLVRLAHWLNAVVLLGMIASGLQIYMAYRRFGMQEEPSPLNWHFSLASPFVITGLVYLGFLVLSGEWRSLLFRPRDIRPAIQMQLYYLRLRKDHPPGAVATLSGFAASRT